MESAYIPVEIVLKVCDGGVSIEEKEQTEESAIMSSNSVSIGTQYDWKLEEPHKSSNLLSSSEMSADGSSVSNPKSFMFDDKDTDNSLVNSKNWSMHSDSNILPEQKILIPTSFSQQLACNISSVPDDKSFLQFDYKTRNKFKTKQRRMDPYYRSQERVRQRTVMRRKRQDPGFRAEEREKGRFRMRLKRLDPEFRSQERERQRERMKAKRSDPEFREREREQQKTRLHIKRLDPVFKEKVRAQDRLRMRIKRENNTLCTNLQSDHIKMCHENENIICNLVSDKMLKNLYKSNDIPGEFQSHQSVFPENFNTKLLSLKPPRESIIESFHFKKQHILNFNFYNTNKEQWSHEFCSRTLTHLSDLNDRTVPPSNSVSELSAVLPEKNPSISRKIDLKIEEDSESLVTVEQNELQIAEEKKT